MKLQVLVLDDQVQYGRSLQRALGREYALVVAATQSEAKQKFTGGIACAISDVRLDESMPDDREGLQFVSWVRAQRPDLPIICMSAVDDPALEAEALRAGATKFLRKPIVISQLKALLQDLLNTKD